MLTVRNAVLWVCLASNYRLFWILSSSFGFSSDFFHDRSIEAVSSHSQSIGDERRFSFLSLPKLMRHLVTKLHSELLHTKVSSQTTQLSSHDSVLEATVVKNVEKIFAYFSKIFPDFKTGAKILWINFLPFLTWIFSCCDPFSFHQIELSGWSLICCSDAAKPSF